MNWPWSELGLDGPASLEEIHHAYAQRAKVTHPEEDPEGFQRLHQAYQAARRIAKKKGSPADPAAASENTQQKPEAQHLEPADEAKEEDAGQQKRWDYEKLLEQEAQKPLIREEPHEIEHWDYEQLFKEAAQQDETKLRQKLQQLSGLTNENDDWEQVAPALRRMDALRQNGMPLAGWRSFLQSPLFERVRQNESFLFALEDWLKAGPPLEYLARTHLWERLQFPAGKAPEKHRQLKVLLDAPQQTAVYYCSKRRSRPSDRKKAIHLLVVWGFLFGIMAGLLLSVTPEVQEQRQWKQLARWLSKDLAMTVEPYKGSVSPKGKGQFRFKAKEMPEFTFVAERDGKRNPVKKGSGYKTNFSNAAFDCRLRQFASENSYLVSEKTGWHWSKRAMQQVLSYHLEVPLVDAEKTMAQLDEFYRSLQQEPWYQENPPRSKLHFVTSGVIYFTIDPEKGGLDVPAAAEYFKKTAPEGVCGFVLKETGLDQHDFSVEEYALFQMEQGIPPEDPDFYFQFAAIDFDTKEILRLYAYSEKKNEIISFPVEAFVKGRPFEELKERSSLFQGAKRVQIDFPKLYQWNG